MDRGAAGGVRAGERSPAHLRRPDVRALRPGGAAASMGLLLALVAFLPAPLAGQVFLTQDEALRLAFPEAATVERRTAFLDEEELRAARERAGSDVEVDRGVVTYYLGKRDGEPLGVAYFDAHRVRTMREVVMFVVSPVGTLERVEILSFAEPREYLASEPWIEQLEGRALNEELAVDRGIVNLTGATLTSGALTRAARRVLALHAVIRPLRGERGEGGGP